ncbi:D-alanyl-D-alanine carboxypeptidase [Alicyclobacillaceae bacterium I2511]|nr:D-alanyl-D-alanine carboxypeptidase [Alicyclobacillaceae bacterium I2511]
MSQHQSWAKQAYRFQQGSILSTGVLAIALIVSPLCTQTVMAQTMLVQTAVSSAKGVSVLGAPANVLSTSLAQGSAQVTPVPVTQAKSILLMDANTGQVLYQKNDELRLAPASTTKLMTLYLALQSVHQHRVQWNEIVPVTPDAVRIAETPGVSDAYLDPREQFTLRQMLQFVSVISASDATVAVADLIGGSTVGFVHEMNTQAKQLGMTGTHFANPDGLPNPNHYSTARDLAILARALVTQYPEVLQFTSMKSVTITSPLRKHPDTWYATDELLGQYPGVDGLKTGFTDAAGFCYVGTVNQGGVRLISAVMGDTVSNQAQRFVDTAKLYNWAYHNFSERTLYPGKKDLSQFVAVPNGQRRQIFVKLAAPWRVILPKTAKGTVVWQPMSLEAPISQGAIVGHLSYRIGNQVVSTVPALAAQGDARAHWWLRLWRNVTAQIAHLLHPR